MDDMRRPDHRPQGFVRNQVSTDAQARLKGLKEGPVVWAIDAFAAQPTNEALRITAESLHATFPHLEVHPVYVLSEETFAERGFSSFLRPALKPLALRSLRAILAPLPGSTLRKPRVLIEPSSSRAACASRLLRYAGRIGASMIALGSTGRSGLARFLAGSFSDAVMNHHRTPVFITGPRASLSKNAPRVVVFPTDFSPACNEALTEIIHLAARLDADLHLFHKAVHNVDPFVQSGVQLLGGGWVSLEAYFTGASPSHDSDGQNAVEEARRHGVRAYFISENFREPTSEAIIDYVRKLERDSPLVAMVPQTGPMSSWLLGSVTRDVIRASPAALYMAGRADA